jgi:hypothetical protein
MTSNSLIPEEGVYPFTVVDARDATSKSGNPMIVADLQLLPDHGTVRAWLVQAARWRLRAFCISVGITPPVDPEAPIHLEAQHCIGRFGFARITHEQWQGRTVAKVDRFIPRLAAIREKPELNDFPLPTQTRVDLLTPVEEKVPAGGDEELPF